MAQQSTTAHPMLYGPDIAIRGVSGDLIAFVEVKNPRPMSRGLALSLYRDAVDHGVTTYAPYFLLVSQRLGFLWKPEEARNEAMAPLVEFPMAGVVARYLPELAEDDRLRGRELDLIVSQWLFSLAIGSQSFSEEPEKSLATSGFLAAIDGALVTIEAANNLRAGVF